MKHVRAWLGAWIALWWLWMLLAGEWNAYERVTAAAAATVAATIGELARARAGVRIRVPRRVLSRSAAVPAIVVVDFGIVLFALVRSAVRREVARGSFRSHSFPVGGGDPESVGVRALTAILATYSPNAYVVELDRHRRVVLVHDLVPFRKSEEPA